MEVFEEWCEILLRFSTKYGGTFLGDISEDNQNLPSHLLDYRFFGNLSYEKKSLMALLFFHSQEFPAELEQHKIFSD